MNPIRTSPSFIPHIYSPCAEEPTPGKPLHEAVVGRDSKAVARRRNEGVRANTLNAQGHSPLDVLDKMRDIDERSRSSLRMALLQSLNPTAPLGYAKPEALHGTPWGLEILQSGALRGGVNDAKGAPRRWKARSFSLIGPEKARPMKPLAQTCAARPEGTPPAKACIPATPTRGPCNTA